MQYQLAVFLMNKEYQPPKIASQNSLLINHGFMLEHIASADISKGYFLPPKIMHDLLLLQQKLCLQYMGGPNIMWVRGVNFIRATTRELG